MPDEAGLLREALDLLVRSAQGRCANPSCPSQHEGEGQDCIDAALRAALAVAQGPAPAPEPNFDEGGPTDEDLDRALPAQEERLDVERGTCWFCKGRFVVDALVAGYDTFDEQRLACLACNERMSGDWRPA